MTQKLTLKQLITLKGNKVYLKKIDKDMLDHMEKTLTDISYETKMLTTTSGIFNRSDIERYLDRINEDSSRTDFFIVDTETDEIVGDIALNDYCDKDRSCNLRLAIDKAKDFGKGYGQEAMFLAMNYGFGMINLNRIELDVLPNNERAIHVYKKLGFKEEGIKRECCYFNHRYHDMMMMSCLYKEFVELYGEVLQESEF